ncbi:MAG TPA: ABC transporter ATP-binding protein [Bacillus sp. (in: firmicutes)]|nr:ABC transporter ATP-binding protein [Bacillus sp. (in: firmicutes)]
MTKQHAESEIKVSSILKSFAQGWKLFQLMLQISKRYTILSLAVNLLLGFIPIIMLVVTQNLLNSVSMAGKNGINIVFLHFSAFIFVYFLKNIIDSIQYYVESNFQNHLSQSLNIMICKKSILFGMQDFENPSISDQLKRAQQEVGYRPYQMLNQMMRILSSVITVFSSAVLLILWKWWVMLALLLISMVSFYSIMKINAEQFRIYMNRTPLNRQSWYLTYLLTNDRSFKEVKLFNLGSYLLQRYTELMLGFFNVDKKIVLKRTRVVFVYDLLELVVLMWLIGLALKEAYLGEILIGSLFGYIQAITLTQSQIQSIVQGVIQFSQNNLYLEQLFLFFKLPTSDPVQLQLQQEENTDIAKKTNLRIEEVHLENVSFKYPGKVSEAIHNVSFTVRKGQIVSLVGKNGSGKSTLVKIIMQLYNGYKGVIKVNGRNVLEENLQLYQDRIGVVFQDFVQYEMSARQNIGFGSLKHMADDQAIKKAAQCAAIDRVLEELPRGLDTQLGKWFQDGHQLSGGQWQRIAIARAFMREADLYIMDEPSSFLDPISERDLFLLFRDLMKEKIGIFITHRFNSARLADLILVMDEGRIVESGTHEELIKANGLYAEMYNIQASSFKTEQESVYQY